MVFVGKPYGFMLFFLMVFAAIPYTPPKKTSFVVYGDTGDRITSPCGTRTGSPCPLLMYLT